MSADASLIPFVPRADLDVDGLRARYRYERDRRLRPEGNRQYVQVTAEFSSFDEDPYVEGGHDREPVSDHVDVAVIGAGWGGLLAGARLRQAGLKRIRLVEHGGDVGGVWYWNRYPGVQCDVESYSYMPLLEETGYMPTRKYASGPEILEHARRVARQFDLYEEALFSTEVTQMRWDEKNEGWTISTTQADRFTAQYVVIANGALSQPKLPGVPGINEFRGHTFHSSRWDYSYTGGDATGSLTGLADKRVGVIGTGASAIQIVPHLAASAKQLYVFQRTPAVVAVRDNGPTDPKWASSLQPGWQRRRIENFTTLVGGGDADVDLVDDAWLDIFQKITPAVVRRIERATGRRFSAEESSKLVEISDLSKGEDMRARVASIVRDPKTAEGLKPWYYLFCKRPCFHDEYLDAFNRPNVELVDTGGQGVERFTETAAVVDGYEYEVDCLIFATGFEVGTGHKRETGYDVVGRDGLRLAEKWSAGPRTLHGMQVNGFPNCFFTGIVQNATSINLTHVLWEQADHIAHVVGTARERDAAVVEATAEAEETWAATMREYAGDMARWQDCTPSYLNSEGNIDDPGGLLAIRFGGGAMRFFEILQQWREQGDLPGMMLRGSREPIRTTSASAETD